MQTLASIACSTVIKVEVDGKSESLPEVEANLESKERSLSQAFDPTLAEAVMAEATRIERKVRSNPSSTTDFLLNSPTRSPST